jgi:adenine-specific DNA methylase
MKNVRQSSFFEDESVAAIGPLEHSRAATALEDLTFPFEEISKIAEQESWRKEINRPIHYIHKWWAHRLGTVFRALVLGASTPSGADIKKLFYERTSSEITVFDPFMGSGTTLGEVLKLGGTAIGRDINPVAYFLVKNALHLPSRQKIIDVYRELEADVAPEILRRYSATMPDGRAAQVLYYFWVKVVPCLHCGNNVDLFSSYVFVQNAYPGKRPEVRIVCPNCGAIHKGLHGQVETRCPECESVFNPMQGPASNAEAKCGGCGEYFRIAEAVKRTNIPPQHRLYAKLLLDSDGNRVYLRADESDDALYKSAERDLKCLADAYPLVAIRPGYNTNQAINYCYRNWHEMFNARQLLCLHLLAKRIRAIEDTQLRELFCCLFSGVLEFNNMFASYKGEGTGAVRHMFSHHVLKPERTPIEANIWGTTKSSGAFSTLFKSRILRAIDYAADPFEVRTAHDGGGKVYGISQPLTGLAKNGSLQLSCGDSSKTSLEGKSVDAVITDPPFFDNVHYSELADFFHVWQRYVLGQNGFHSSETTRALGEVQHSDHTIFAERLLGVWKECKRVLKDDGLLVFTYHHSGAEGWTSLLTSLTGSGFYVVRVHPIRSEMSIAMPKHQAKEPINLDMVFVCRKASKLDSSSDVLVQAQETATHQAHRLSKAGFHLSTNDVRIILFSNVVQLLSTYPPGEADMRMKEMLPSIEVATSRILAQCAAAKGIA